MHRQGPSTCPARSSPVHEDVLWRVILPEVRIAAVLELRLGRNDRFLGIRRCVCRRRRCWCTFDMLLFRCGGECGLWSCGRFFLQEFAQRRIKLIGIVATAPQPAHVESDGDDGSLVNVKSAGTNSEDRPKLQHSHARAPLLARPRHHNTPALTRDSAQPSRTIITLTIVMAPAGKGFE